MCIQCLILLDSEHCSRWGVCVVKKLLPSKTEGSMCAQGLGMGRFWYLFIFYKSELFKVLFTVFFLYILLNIYSYLIIKLVNLNKEYS